MYLKLKRWLGDLNWFNIAQLRPYIQQQKATIDVHELAFQLAAMDDLDHDLPKVLIQLHTTFNQNFPETSLSLMIVFQHVVTNEAIFYGEQSTCDDALLRHSLNQQLASDLNVSHTLLCETQHQRVSLICLFKREVPTLKQRQWITQHMEQGLNLGLKLWCKNNDNVAAAIQKERALYAAELHDSIAQILAYLRMKTVKLDQLCNHAPHTELKSLATDLANYTHSAYQQTRELIVSSRLTFQSDNFSQAIANSITEFEQQSGIVFELDNRLGSQPLASNHAMQIMCIVRESLSNIVRHAHATHARVILLLNDERYLIVKIEDNGKGIDPTEARNDSFGLHIMKERAGRINAELTINDRTAGGTIVQLRLPLGAHDA
jgi:nitrate/nitrite-specific signal transduction histidine kinase